MNLSDLRVSICIPTRNQGKYLCDALGSAFAQTVQPIEVVISDDAGTDDTEIVVKNFRQSLSRDRANLLRYDRSPVALGIGGNFDRAVRLGNGEYCIKLDADDILEPNFAEVLAGELQLNPQAGWAHCNVLNIHPDCSPIGLAHTRKKSGFYAAETALPAYLNHNDTCHCVMIRKSAYLAVGGYRPEMKTCEDWLFWLEMLLAGWGYVFDARPLARMRKHANRRELMSRRRVDFVESARFMIPRVEKLLRNQPETKMGLPVNEALARFRAATSRLCVSSGCGEGDPAVRSMLFEAAVEIHPSLKNRLWLAAGLPLPAAITESAGRIGGLPRHWARVILGPLFKRVSRGS
jgi:glycosyltransferase involved in cell wall biosynthesis